MIDRKPEMSGALVSGVISTVIGAGVVLALSLFIPLPWTLSQTLIAVALSSFCGSAVGFWKGRTGV